MTARLSIVLMGALALVCIAKAADAQRFPSERITAEQWAAYLAEIKSLPTVSIKESNQQITISQEKPDLVIYAFTTPNNPAHPAVVVRTLVKRDDGFFINREGHYAGGVSEFQRWWRAFDSLDEKMKADLNRTPRPQATGDITPNARHAEAEALAVTWLDLINAGNDQDSYAMLSEVFKKGLTPELWRTQIKERQRKLGKLASRKLRRIVWYKDPPSASLPGTYGAVEFDSTFENTDGHFQYLILHSQSGEPFLVMRSEENSIRKGSAKASEKGR